MRLTKKMGIAYEVEDFSNSYEAIDKLGQLEDIEENIGKKLDIDNFDLLFVLKVITGTAYFKDRDGEIVKAQSVSFGFESGEFQLHRRKGIHFVDYEDYGKTWAITKEELL